MGEAEGKKRRVVESLGWLTESSIMPKKHRAIDGVGASSILELKAQLYKSQEESKKNKDFVGPDVEFHRAKLKITPNDSFSRQNSGVQARSHKDKLELKAVNDGSACYAALERKAELYEKLVKGELSDEEDNEKYCVDFFHKGLVQDKPEQPQGHVTFASIPPADEVVEDDASVLFNVKSGVPGLGQNTGIVDNNEHKRILREVHVEASRAREKASEVKLRREEQATARREKLKQAYIRKKLEKLKAASSTEQT